MIPPSRASSSNLSSQTREALSASCDGTPPTHTAHHALSPITHHGREVILSFEPAITHSLWPVAAARTKLKSGQPNCSLILRVWQR